MISTLPVTCNGPLRCGATLSGPLRVASASEGSVAGSPVASKPAATWLESQYGLRCDSPQRHSVARMPFASPATVSSPRKASGPFSRTLTVFTTGACSSALPSDRLHWMAPEGQLCAISSTSSAVARSG